jgi:serine protease Do
MGIGFAVPINLVRRTMEAIIQYGKVMRGYLGVYIQDLTPQLAKEFGLKERGGALIGGVPPNTPAAEAGLHEGDVVTEFNGRKVPDSRQLRLWVSQTPPKTKVALKVIRDGKEQTKQLTLGELPSEMASASGPGGRDRSGGAQKSDALDGVEVTDLDTRTRRQFEIPNEIKGAVVTSVDPTSTAATAGLRPGDVIVEINRKKVSGAQDAIDVTNNLKSDQSILLRVWSVGRGGGGTRFVIVEPDKKSNDQR